MSQKRIIILDHLVFLQDRPIPGYTAQLWKTLKGTAGEGDHLGSELGSDVLLKVKYSSVSFPPGFMKAEPP